MTFLGRETILITIFMPAERPTITEAKRIYQSVWERMKSGFGWTGKEALNIIEETIELRNGYRLKATFRPDTWMEIRVLKGDEGALSFVMRDTGLQSIGSRNPVLVGLGAEVKLGHFGIGLEGELQAVQYPIEQSDEMDKLGIHLADWIWNSVQMGELLPIDLSVKFPLLPSRK